MPMVGKHKLLSALLLFSWNEIGSIEKMEFGREVPTRDSLGLGGVSVYYRLRISGRGDRASSLSGRVGPLWIGGT